MTGRLAVAPPDPAMMKVQVPTPTGVTVMVNPEIDAVATVAGHPVAVNAALAFVCEMVAVFAFAAPTALKLKLVGAIATGPGVGVGATVAVGEGVGVGATVLVGAGVGVGATVAVGAGVGVGATVLVGVGVATGDVGGAGRTVLAGPHAASDAAQNTEINPKRIA